MYGIHGAVVSRGPTVEFPSCTAERTLNTHITVYSTIV